MISLFSARVATLRDAEGIDALLSASYPLLLRDSYPADILDAALPMMTRSNPKLLASGSFHVAETSDGAIIGCGGWSKARPGGGEVEPGTGHIRHFATHPQWTRLGVAKSLLAHCVAEAAAAELSSIECQSTRPAEHFYAAQGFRRIAEIDVVMTHSVKFPAVLMRQNLAHLPSLSPS